MLPPGEELRTKRGCDERTVGPVLGLVHGNQRVTEHRTHDLGEDLRRVGLVVAQHRHHLVVAEHVEPRVTTLVDGRHVLRKRPLALHRTVPAGRREVRVGIVDGPQLDRVGQLEGIEPRSPGPGLDCHLSWPAPRVLAHARQGSGLGPLAESSASPDSKARPRARGGRARGPPRPDAVRATPPLPCASRLPSSP